MSSLSNSDILEVRIYDSSHQIFFKGKARVKDKNEINLLKKDIKAKGLDLFESGWFD